MWPFSKSASGGGGSSSSGSGAASAASQQPAAATAASPDASSKPKKKICCACPDTKRLRDGCIAERGEEHPYCAALIEAHKACLRLEGFNV